MDKKTKKAIENLIMREDIDPHVRAYMEMNYFENPSWNISHVWLEPLKTVDAKEENLEVQDEDCGVSCCFDLFKNQNQKVKVVNEKSLLDGKVKVVMQNSKNYSTFAKEKK